MKKILTHNQKETFELAARLAKDLKAGEVLALSGELGGGKTTFTQGLAKVLKVEEPVTSPTFTILKTYQGELIDGRKITLIHIDAYRVETAEDIKSVGIEDYLNRQDVIMVVEWADKIREILPANNIEINFKFIDETTREISMN